MASADQRRSQRSVFVTVRELGSVSLELIRAAGRTLPLGMGSQSRLWPNVSEAEVYAAV